MGKTQAEKMSLSCPEGTMDCYIHEISSYKFHMHDDLYEIDIMLKGSMNFSNAKKVYRLEENDIIIVNPGTGHASFALEPDAVAIVIHLPKRIFRKFLKEGERCDFDVVSSSSDREEPGYRRMRMFSAILINYLFEGSAVSLKLADAALKLMTACMISDFHPSVSMRNNKTDMDQTVMRQIIDELAERYGEKVTLEEFAEKYGYNRTYLSSTFKKTIGIGLYDYLTMIRFQHAVWELWTTNKTLTSIAMDCGFAEAKLLNYMFRDHFGMMPSEYRKLLEDRPKEIFNTPGTIFSPDEPFIVEKLQEYMRI